MKSKGVTRVLDMAHERKESEDKISEYGMAYIVQNGCRKEVQTEGQILDPPVCRPKVASRSVLHRWVSVAERKEFHKARRFQTIPLVLNCKHTA